MAKDTLPELEPCEGLEEARAAFDSLIDDLRAENPSRPDSHMLVTLFQCLVLYFRDLPSVKEMSDGALEVVIVAAYRELMQFLAEEHASGARGH